MTQFCACSTRKFFSSITPPFVFNRKSRPCSLDWRAITRATVYIAKDVARAAFRKWRGANWMSQGAKMRLRRSRRVCFWWFYRLINQLNKVSLSSLLKTKWLAAWESGKTCFGSNHCRFTYGEFAVSGYKLASCEAESATENFRQKTKLVCWPLKP